MMKKKMLFQLIVPSVLILALVYGFLVWMKTKEGQHSHGNVKVGEIVPVFNFIPMTPNGQFQGDSVSLESYRGKILILNFWATWCESCISEMPSLQKLYETYHADGLELVALSVDEDPESVVLDTLRTQGWKIPVFYDHEQKGSEIFDIEGLPSTAIIDREGQLLEFTLGEKDWMSTDSQRKIKNWLKP